jgi:hypothetical protein
MPPPPIAPYSAPPFSGPPYQQAYPPPPPVGYPGQPFYAPMVMTLAPPTSGYAVASMVLGIVGIFSGFCTFAIPCLLAVVFGHLGYNETKTGAKGGKGMAIAGLVMGYLFVVPAIIIMAVGGISSILPTSP